jgi:ribosomal protein L35
MNGKTNKSFTKRLKITKSGKVLRRKSGINHFQAKKKRSKQLNKKSSETFIIKPKLLSRLIDN